MPVKTKVLEILEATTGGTRRHLAELVAGLDKNRFDVSVTCSVLRDPEFLQDLESMREQGIRVTVIPMVRRIAPIRDLVAFFRIYALIKKEKFDVVHTHSSKAGILGRWAAFFAGSPRIIHTPHVFPFQMQIHPVKRGFYALMERMTARLTQTIVCVSQAEWQEATSQAIVPSGGFVLIPNGIPPSSRKIGPFVRQEKRASLGIPENALVIGTAGRFTLQKGLDHFIHAARTVANQDPDAVFIMAGEGELKAHLSSLIQELSLSARFHILPPQKDMTSFYAMLDIFVLSSLWEGLPYSLLEAMQSGKAVVATKIGGVPEIITNEENGLLVPTADSDALARELIRASALVSREKLGKAAADTIEERFPLSRMIRDVESLYTGDLIHQNISGILGSQ